MVDWVILILGHYDCGTGIRGGESCGFMHHWRSLGCVSVSNFVFEAVLPGSDISPRSISRNPKQTNQSNDSLQKGAESYPLT